LGVTFGFGGAGAPPPPSVFNNIVTPQDFEGNFYLFKKDIEPRWEHDDNKNGGKYQIELPMSTKTKKDLLDIVWQNSVRSSTLR